PGPAGGAGSGRLSLMAQLVRSACGSGRLFGCWNRLGGLSAPTRVRSHDDTAHLYPPFGLFVVWFDEFQHGTATRAGFGRRHSLGNKFHAAQLVADYAAHFRAVEVV